MKRLLTAVLMVLCGLVLDACSVPATSQVGSSPPADVTSVTSAPSVRPSASPAALSGAISEADLLAQFLADVKPIRARIRKLESDLHHAIWEESSTTADSTWPPAGRKVMKLTDRFDGIMVDLQLIEVPVFMRPAMNSLARGVHIERTMYDKIGGWLVSKKGWSKDTPAGKQYLKRWRASREAYDAWRIKVNREAKRYGVDIPWKWDTR